MAICGIGSVTFSEPIPLFVLEREVVRRGVISGGGGLRGLGCDGVGSGSSAVRLLGGAVGLLRG